MRSAAFLGNSHVAALKLGLDRLAAAGRLEGVAVEVFGASSNGLARARIAAGRLEPGGAEGFRHASGGQTALDLERYDDLYVVCGQSPRSAYGAFTNEDLPPLGRPILAAIARAILDDWPARLAAVLAAERPSLRVHLVGQPYFAESRPIAAKVYAAAATDEALARRLAELRPSIDAVVGRLATPFASMPAPPPACLDRFALFTRAAFTRGSVELRNDMAVRAVDDDVHMNADYGEAAVAALLGVAPAQPRPSPAA